MEFKINYKIDDYIISFNDGNDIEIYSEIVKRKLKKSKCCKGYYHFWMQGKYKKVHHIIAEYHFGKRPDKYCVNHKDGNKLNNHISNLEYVTLAENTRHSYLTGLHALAKSIKNSPTYKDGRCKNIKEYKSNWYKKNKEKILAKAKIKYINKIKND